MVSCRGLDSVDYADVYGLMFLGFSCLFKKDRFAL